MAADCKVSVCSRADTRSAPLFACICGDSGAVERFMTNVFNCDATLQACFLSCVPTQFQRLGKDSRALVMSLYRAIVERLGIMRARGDCASRPAAFAVCA